MRKYCKRKSENIPLVINALDESTRLCPTAVQHFLPLNESHNFILNALLRLFLTPYAHKLKHRACVMEPQKVMQLGVKKLFYYGST